MTRRPPPQRILTIASTSKGFGFAVLDGGSTLADWGVNRVARAKNSETLAQVKKLVVLYRPDLLVLEEASSSRRGPRIRRLIGQINSWATGANIAVKLYPFAAARRMFLPDGIGTKDDFAAAVAQRFPESLEHALPAKRRTWMSEDARMGMFQAVALAFMPQLGKPKSSGTVPISSRK